MTKVILRGYVLACDQDISSIERELSKHIELTLKEAGCLAFQVSQDTENRHRFNVYEEFTDKNSFDVHQARAKSSRWGQVSANLEKHYHITDGV
jgi:autoinducer 2-degrading protein